jgi:hypothetical protein
MANSVSAQSASTLPNGYYIVVAFYLSGQEKFAKKYSAELNKAGRHSSHGFDAVRNYY